ncbi:N5,N10-methylenetetrahydromethanopterin reductase-related protein, MSMEG5498 family [[Actinomadura] parvosata subsp. kistnae]|uniref:LLM class F420-dependent oxidoreductase n=1 Tax=[Actinomadura] parvosata subsp. kistnae TaxID=1909395 RepID=A0A1V0A6V0_9ACTN|nr:LLM class flavin-dependent oxidoreductase [Nonomuraea sp. ATCC 55076]AQZ65937.1 LLM class F420-dependent oxidoreductase [Nonomuraea sp. ATCC 55076]SPL97394.1 N5,N10-methylenetetrahydromethanopterin reductase-related protein, MSMEG5498 family [Actinomadura parvosata subsp. kistnae]
MTETTHARFAVSLPQQIPDGDFDPAAFRAYLRRAEELGFHSAWAREGTLSPVPTLGPIEVMTYAAACTERLRLGCAVFVSALHQPLHLAKSLASLDQLSGGRLEVGVGLGSRDLLAPFGVPAEGIVSRFTEGIELMQACWSESKLSFQGRFWQVEGAMEPKAYQKPYPPLWMGGHQPAAIRRAIRYGTGFVGAGAATTAAFAEQVRTLRAELERAERDPASFKVAKRVYISVGDPRRVETPLTRMYGSADMAVTGPPDACAQGLDEVLRAGADLVLLDPISDEAAQLERLAGEVLPALF